MNRTHISVSAMFPSANEVQPATIRPVTEKTARRVYVAARRVYPAAALTDSRVGLGSTLCGLLSFSLTGLAGGAALAVAASTSLDFFAPVCLSASARSFGSVIL